MSDQEEHEGTRLDDGEAARRDREPAPAGDATVTGWPRAAAGNAGLPEWVGPYRLIEKLGEGGMGAVYLAEQRHPIRRRVALKLTHGTVHTERMLRRFEAERQALALMNHPHIAHVYDAGSTSAGQPYFAMELVDGAPITEYCDRERLDLRGRLELFARVCDGVQHAHQKGVIHRDLKPSNVLVASDGEPVPKIIDFGIAKAIDEPLTDATPMTRDGSLLGTPAYMAPERIASDADVDTRADIYSLGVILYELLTGKPPYLPGRNGLLGMAQQVLTVEVTRPSGALAGLPAPQLAEVADRRSLDSEGLRRRLRGDLDWITLKATARERERRYASAAELAADVRRFLADEPVEASPPSAGYRVAKFVRRHWTGVAAAAMIVLALVAGILGTSFQAIRANREAHTAEQVSEFLVGLFEVADPSSARGETVTAKEILDRGAERIEVELAGQPMVQARLLRTIGIVYHELGLYEQSEPLLASSVEILRDRLGEDDVTVAAGEADLAWLYNLQGRYDEAEALARRALGVQERELGANHIDTAKTLDLLQIVYANQGLWREAEEVGHRACSIMETELGVDNEQTTMCLNNLALLYLELGQGELAAAIQQRVVDIEERTLGLDHPGLITDLGNLATIYQRIARYDEAEAILRRALPAAAKVFGTDHAQYAATLHNLATVVYLQGRAVEAEPLQLAAVSIGERAMGEDHPRIAVSRKRLAEIYLALGKVELVEPLVRRCLETWQGQLEPGHPLIAAAELLLAQVRLAEGRTDDAVALVGRAEASLEALPAIDDPALARSIVDCAGRLRAAGLDAEAERLAARVRRDVLREMASSR